MISIDFSLAVSLYIIIFVGIVLIFWLFSKKQKERSLSLDPKFIWHCYVCTHTYINTKEDTLSLCPRCGSYNKREIRTKND